MQPKDRPSTEDLTARRLVPRRYRVVCALGQGGEGSVYKVRDLYGDGAPLALKVVPFHGEASGSQRIRREFSTLSTLAHPAIARVRDFGFTAGGGSAYFTSDYIDGTDLLTWFVDHPVEESWGQVAQLVAQILGGLHAIHRSGCFHGDLKPSNLLVTSVPPEGDSERLEWRATIIDFGGVRLRRMTADGSGVWSTPAYRAPAALRGDGVREDLYALGLTLYHAFVGRLPFELGDEASRASWQQSGELARLSKFVDGAPNGIPTGIVELVARLTSCDPARCFASAVEALQDLGKRMALPGAPRAQVTAPRRLYGREDALGRLERELDTTPSRSGPLVVLVSAPPGIGKSTVVEGLASRLQLCGWETVKIRASDPGRGVGELLLRSGLDLESSVADEEETADQALRILENLPPSPRVLVTIDDWSSREPRQLVERLLEEWIAALLSRFGKRPPGLRVVVATAEPEAFSRRLRPPEGAVSEYRLGPLDRVAVRELTADFFQTDQIPDDLGDVVERLSAGRPAEVWWLLRGLASGGARLDSLGFLNLPGGWREDLERASKERATAARVELADPRAEGLLAAFAALDGLPVTCEQFRELFGDDIVALRGCREGDWWEALQGLCWQGTLERHGEGYRLPAGPTRCQPSSRGVERLIDGLDAGEWLVDWRDPDVTAPLSRLLVRYGRDARAVSVALLAARQLRDRSRHGEAIGLLEGVLEGLHAAASEARQVTLVALRCAQFCRLSGEVARGLATLARCDFSQARRAVAAAATLLEAAFLEEVGRTTEAIERLEELLRERQESGDEGPLSYQLSARLADLYFRSSQSAKARERLARSDDLLERFSSASPLDGEDAAGWVDAAARFGVLQRDHGERDAAVSLLELGRSLAAAGPRANLEEFPLHELATVFAVERRFDDADAAFASCQRLAEERRDRVSVLRALVNRATLQLRAGRLQKAERIYRRARTLSDSLGPNRCAATILVGLEVVRREQGDLLGALRLLKQILRSDSTATSDVRLNALFNLGEIYLALGRPVKAVEVRGRALELAARTGDRRHEARASAGVAATRLALGDFGGAEQALDRARDLVDSPTDRLAGIIACLRGQLLLAASGRDSVDGCAAGGEEGALELFGRAMRVCRLNRNATYLELAALGVVEVLLRQGRQHRARRVHTAFERLMAGRGEELSRSRYPFLREAYAGICRGEGTGRRHADAGRALLEIIERARSRGHVWEALQVAALLVRSSAPRADRTLARSAREVFEDILGFTLRRAPRVAIDRLRRGLLGPVTATIGKGLAGEASHGDRERPSQSVEPAARAESAVVAALGELAERWTTGGGLAKNEDNPLEEELERVRATLGVAGLWVLNDPEARGPLTHPASGCSGEVVEALAERRAELEATRRRGKASVGEDWCLVALGSGRPATRVLYLTWREGAAPWLSRERESRGAGVPRPVAVAAGLVSLLLRVRDLDDALKAATARSREQQDEIRRLHAQIVREKSHLETDVLSGRAEAAEVRRQLDDGGGADGSVVPVAVSPAMREVVRRARVLAETDLPVLILGEHGVGKDRLARFLQALSPRAGQPFEMQVCQVPPTLLESELFGAVKGSFTGADRDRLGLLRRCDGGTLYLDQIEEMAADVQAKLIRFTEELAVRPVGGDEAVRVDVRLVSSTCLTANQLGDDTRIRQDLLFRLRGDVLEVPPLRDRPEDIPELFRSFLEQYCREFDLPVPEVDPRVFGVLQERAWPGNVRQLENEVRRALLEKPLRILPENFDSTDAVEPRPIAGRRSGPRKPSIPSLQDARRDLEKQLLIDALRHHGGNATKAARTLEVSRRHLGTLLSRHGVNPLDFRE